MNAAHEPGLDMHEPGLDMKVRAAIAELESTIAARYPTATFDLSRGIDEPRAVHLNVTVDLDDPFEVLDFVIDRVVELQVEEGIPLHVIPLHTPERVLAQIEEWERRHSSKGVLAPGESQPISR